MVQGSCVCEKEREKEKREGEAKHVPHVQNW